MKTLTTLILLAAINLSANPLTKALQPKLQPDQDIVVDWPTPVKRNILDIDGKKYLLPDYLKIIKGQDGKFQIENKLDHKVGNGGDYLRGQYFKVGRQVLNYLNDTEAGQKLVTSQRLDLSELESSLHVERVVVVNDLLIDNSGSVVDAIGVPNLVLLNAASWKEHFENSRNIYYLVFHEMLRSSAVNDDNYIISQALLSFPQALQVSTVLIPTAPLIDEDNLSTILKGSKIVTGGTGCANQKHRLFTDLNLASNDLEISLYDYVAKLSNGSALDRKSCSLNIPVNLPANKKLVISLIDIQGNLESSSTDGAQAKLTFEAFLAGSSQKAQIKTMHLTSGKRSFLFRKTNTLSSTCGGESILRINSSIILTRANSIKPTQLQVPVLNEIAQVKKIKVSLSLEDCQ
jgi:hypothetical protein